MGIRCNCRPETSRLGPDARIRIAELAEFGSVPNSGMNAPPIKGGVSWLANMACRVALGVQRTSIEQSPAAASEFAPARKIQLLLCPVKFPAKQQKFKQERAALGVEWIGPQLRPSALMASRSFPSR